MQYCYNLIGIKEDYGNFFGLCLEQEEPWVNGQIVVYGDLGYTYTVYKCIQFFFKTWDSARYMGDFEGFDANPSLVIGYNFSSLKINGVEKLTSPFVQNYDASTYQNYIAPAAGYDHYAAPWEDGELNNTKIATEPLNAMFAAHGIPIQAIMYTSAGGVMDYVCLLIPEGMTFEVELSKTWQSMTMYYKVTFDPSITGTASYRVNDSTYIYDTDETYEDLYVWVSTEKCPTCFDGNFCFTLQSCNKELYPSVYGLCTTDADVIANDGKIVQAAGYDGYYTLIFNGLDACICELALPAITVTDLEECPSGTVYSYEIEDCLTGIRQTISTTTLITIDDACGCIDETWNVNPETGLCEKYDSIESATSEGDLIEIEAGVTSTAYGWGGALFYGAIDARPKPIRIETSPNLHLEDSTDIELPILSTRNLFWDNTSGSNGRLNTVGVRGSVPNNEWVGLSYCSTHPFTRTVNIGVGADNAVRVKINGVTVIDLNNHLNQYAFNYWHIFEVTLTAGFNVIEFVFRNQSSAMSFGAEIYNANRATLEGFTDESEVDSVLLFSTRDYVTSFFTIGENSGFSCPEGYAVADCAGTLSPSCELIQRVSQLPCPEPVIELNEFPCKCFKVIRTIDGSHDFVTVKDTYATCEECLDQIGKCSFSERTVAMSLRIKLPEEPIPDRGFKSCCYENKVFASLTSSKIQHNDFNGFYFQRQTPVDTCDFVLIKLSDASEYALDSATYGEYVPIGGYLENPDLTTYIVRWKKVLALLGTGAYQIKKEISIAGMSFTMLSNTYNLHQYTEEAADKTVRIDCKMNGTLVHYGVDFKGTNFTTSLRTGGFFGRREPEYVQDNLVRRNYRADQIQMSQENEYQYQTNLLPECITEELFDFILFGDELYISDYNGNNHSYKFTRFEVELKSNKGTEYYVTGRPAQVNLTFADRFKNKRKTNC